MSFGTRSGVWGTGRPTWEREKLVPSGLEEVLFQDSCNTADITWDIFFLLANPFAYLRLTIPVIALLNVLDLIQSKLFYRHQANSCREGREYPK